MAGLKDKLQKQKQKILNLPYENKELSMATSSNTATESTVNKMPKLRHFTYVDGDECVVALGIYGNLENIPKAPTAATITTQANTLTSVYELVFCSV